MEIDYSERINPVCDVCDDSGWQPKFCDGRHDVICGRRRAHLPHDFSVLCPCRPMNRVWQEKQGNYLRTA